MTPTAKDLRALARSSPWLWRSAHLRYRGGLGRVEAWVERPGRLRLRFPSGAEQVVEEGPPSAVWVPLGGAARAPEWRRPHEVEPVRRRDGLIRRRPRDLGVVYDDPVWRDYSWVALLDPVELAAGVELDALASEERAGRETWTARAVPVEGYEPRCGCCALLWSAVAARDSGLPVREGATYPPWYDVALDRATGIVVSVQPGGTGFEPSASLSSEVEVVAHTAW
ncbi:MULTISPECIES: hypothetical protein [unclassified Nocardioides]|uniref:hypothetical protein n=1 Tax=unclassified Nocardioides TaxID=2615069 RepID=UPI0024054022|nr:MULTISPECIES: hypothetical protein [unclassified Nocardioides]MDF9716088.1 hypothetical protein [Nocardioides sp. ChNu-99]